MTNFVRENKKIFFYGAVIILGIWLGTKFFGNDDNITYITEKVQRQNIQKVVNAAGEVRAIQLVTVGAQVSGKIETLYVTVGQVVKKGDLIAEIDSTTQQNEVDINKAKLNSYEAQLAAAKVSLKIAEKKYKRTQALRKQNAASAEDLEDAEDAYETAKSKVTELDSTIKETEISLSTAETNLGYTKITAPLDGTIVSVPVKQGQTINAAMDTPTIVQIADLSQTVPATAIKNEGQGKFVEILTKNGVEKRSVVTGVSDGLNIEVKSGVKEGEEAVLAKMSSAEISDKTSKIRGPRGF